MSDATKKPIQILDQNQLREIYLAGKEKNWDLVQDNQLNLKATLVKGYEDNWQKYIAQHPGICPTFDVTSPESQEFLVTREIAEKYNLAGHLKEFDKKSDNSTAGIRAFYDITHSENPSMMYNDLFLALLIDAEARFMEEVHREIGSKLTKIEESDPNFSQFIIDLKAKLRPADIKIIEEIYNMSLAEIIPFCRDNIVKLVGGEVRAHTNKFVELEARILAAKGVTVITAVKYDDSIPIYMHSFLSFVLGVTGATNYTPSHSSNYLFGRKVLAIGGGQLLPDKYENYRKLLRNIIDDEIINGQGYTLRISKADHPNIKRNLTYKRMVGLYKPVLNVTAQDVETINNATSKGHRITLNCLNGSTWKTLSPLLDELKIDKTVFDLEYESEDPFFDIGYIVTEEKGADGGAYYSIDHLGTDVSMTKVGQTIPYKKFLSASPIGRKVYECDADSDRFCVKQIIENNQVNKDLIKTYSLDNYILDGERILVALSPNKMFLLLDVADYERMKAQGIWDKYYSLYLITYTSTRAWAEFGDAVPGMKKILTRVGYKNLTEMQQLVEKWYFDQPELKEFEFQDQLGNKVQIDRTRAVRVHCKEEESGGRVAGMNNDCFSILGNKTLAMPEKSDPDSVFSELTLSSVLYLKTDTQMNGEYRLLGMMDRVFDLYHLKSKVDSRIDIMHGDQGSIALLPYADQQRALESAGDLKSNFNNFFFSLGQAVREGQISLEKVTEVLMKVVPSMAETWKCLNFITLCDEPLSAGRTRPEGVPMVFEAKDGRTPMVTELDFRPSGTDPLKSKIYIDAEQLSRVDRELIEEEFSNLTGYDLYSVLDYYKIKSISEPSAATAKLKKFSLK
jgi:hypothetical protein